MSQHDQGVGRSGPSPIIINTNAADAEKATPLDGKPIQTKAALPSAQREQGIATQRKSERGAGKPTFAQVMEIPESVTSRRSAQIAVVREHQTVMPKELALPTLGKTKAVSDEDILGKLEELKLGNVKLNEGKRIFETDDEAERVESHVKGAGGELKMSREFGKSLYKLAQNSPTAAKRVAEELQQLAKAGEPGDAVKKFVRYEVYKVITEHKQNMEEFKQNTGLATDLLTACGISERTKGYDEAAKIVTKEFAANCMCRCIYTSPLPSLVRKDELFAKNDRTEPGDKDRTELGERLRATTMEEKVCVFATRAPADSKQDIWFQVAYPKTMAKEDAAKFLPKDRVAEDKNAEDKNRVTENNVFYVPYDPDIQVLATVQVPVMKAPTEITVKLPEGIEPKDVARNEDGSFTLRLGTGPERMFPFPEEPEDAGTYRRSLNSQRVIEVSAPRADARHATLQIKGGGVPAYGFNHNRLLEKTGGEYFDLKGDARLAEFHEFAAKLLELKSDICQLGNAYVQGPTKETELPSGDDKAGRFGGLSFRVDNAAGLRFPDLAENKAIRSRLAGETQSHDLVAFAQETEVIDDDTQKAIAASIQTAIKNYAAANLLGMVYEDSNLHNLTDLGARGSFPDAGTMNVAGLQNATLFFQTIGAVAAICMPNEDPVELYREAFREHLKALADNSDDYLSGMAQYLDPNDSDGAELTATEAEEAIGKIVAALVGDKKDVSKALDTYRDGLAGYKEYLAGVLETYMTT